MADSNTTTETVSIEEAVKRLVEVDRNNASKISRLESQIDEYREQSTSSNREELRNMSEKIHEIQSTTIAFQQETNTKFEEIKHHWDCMYTDMKSDMNGILIKLNETSGPTISTLTLMPKEETRTEEDERKQDITGKDIPDTPHPISGRPFQPTAFKDNFFPTRTFELSPHLTHAEQSQRTFIPSAHSLNHCTTSLSSSSFLRKT
jgi:hypothetical protein